MRPSGESIHLLEKENRLYHFSCVFHDGLVVDDFVIFLLWISPVSEKTTKRIHRNDNKDSFVPQTLTWKITRIPHLFLRTWNWVGGHFTVWQPVSGSWPEHLFSLPVYSLLDPKQPFSLIFKLESSSWTLRVDNCFQDYLLWNQSSLQRNRIPSLVRRLCSSMKFSWSVLLNLKSTMYN